MKIIFAGTPEFAAQALTSIHQAGFDVVQVLTQPDRPKGRGLKMQKSAVKISAESWGIPVYQPVSLKDDSVQDVLRAQNADVMVVAAYGLLLPQAVLDIPKYGCLNIHASLLPRWRGAAPIQRAVEAGDKQTGVCIMQMDAGLDTGPVFSRRVYHIQDDDTSQEVHDALAQLGAEEIVAVLQQIPHLHSVAQSSEGITYAHKLKKEDAKIDWQSDALQIVRQIRAFNPFPGAYTVWRGQIFKIWSATYEATDSVADAGSVIAVDASGVLIAAKSQSESHMQTEPQAAAVRLLEVQLPGGKKVAIRDFLNAHSISLGEIFGGEG